MFQLFNHPVNFAAVAVTLPALSGGLGWTNRLAQNGTISVIVTQLIPTIPPAITNFSLLGANVVISGTNGQAGGTYYLLASTNLATPLTQWKTVATNVLSASNYTFVGTNNVTAGAAQQFFMLSSTNFNP